MPTPSATDGRNAYPLYSPRFWHGMRPATWWQLVGRHGGRVSLNRAPLLASVSLITPVNTAGAITQAVVRRRAIAETDLAAPPVFIIGHWRSGTTMLHELMIRDQRLSSPTTFQCFAPHHFLVSEWFFRRFARWLLPNKRPMDDMAAGWDRPQEDEFALMNLGLPSPYRRIAFPDDPRDEDSDYLDFRGVEESDRAAWAETLRTFLRHVTVATGRPLVVKSPTHTGRVATLMKHFPGAKFIHLSRDPRSLYPSTIRLWESLDADQALREPLHDPGREERLRRYVLDCLTRMHAAYRRDRERLDASHLIEIRYEDLIADPVGTLETIYQRLHLGDFASVRGSLQSWVDTSHRNYTPNRHTLPPDTEAMLRDHWRDYFETYGYTD